jgi:hypothetical protein
MMFFAGGVLFLRLVPAGTPAATPRQDDQTPCCFTNPNYQGTCVVTPGKDETCDTILQYLNSASTVGKTYCGGTRIRGGWQQVDCEPQGQRGVIPGRK